MFNPTTRHRLPALIIILSAVSIASCGDGAVDSTDLSTDETSSNATAGSVEQEQPANSNTNDESPVKIHASYSVLAPTAEGGPVDTLIYARIILDGRNATCPVLTGSTGLKLPTQARGLHPDAAANTDHFPVTVCEGLMSENVSYTDETRQVQLSAVTLDPANILVYGDSGCKLQKSSCAAGSSDSGCHKSYCKAGSPSKYFEKLAQVGAKQNPQLILHMGDYNYRGTAGSINGSDYAYDAGDGGYGGSSCGLQTTYYSQNAVNSPRPDIWSNWQVDFFVPAQAVLSKAPWVFARGNHELCSRAGPGWFYFLGPGSSLNGGIAQTQCSNQGDLDHPPAAAEGHISMIDPYFVHLKQLQLWVLDSANACDAQSSNKLTAQYQAQFETLQQEAGLKTTWMMTHRPLWGVQNTGSASINTMLQVALSQTPASVLPASLTLSLSGHMHIYQSLSFVQNGGRPPQIVIGNSGVSLNSKAVQGDFVTPVNGSEAYGNASYVHGINGNGSASDHYGFLSLQFQPSGAWKGSVLNDAGNTLWSCDSNNLSSGERICTFAAH